MHFRRTEALALPIAGFSGLAGVCPRVALALLVFLTACGPGGGDQKPEEKPSAPGIELSKEEVQSLGIKSVAAQAATFQREVLGYGVVTPLDAIAQANSDLLAASATAAQSAAAAARARALSTGDEAAVSREAEEVAASKAAADEAALALARRKSEAAFGLHAPWRDPARRNAIMSELASGKLVLVRVTFPLGALGPATPTSLKIRRLGSGAQGWTAHQVWDAPADPAFPGRGFYALVAGSDLAQNEHVIAGVAIGAPQTGLAVPASALLLGEGQSSVYVEIAPNHFLRTRISTDKPLPGGYFVSPGSGIAPGQRIVTDGAGLLLSHEINPSTDAGG